MRPDNTCGMCSRFIHVHNCKGCGRSCACHQTTGPTKVKGEPLTADWEKNILKGFITRHGAANVREALTKLEAQLGAS